MDGVIYLAHVTGSVDDPIPLSYALVAACVALYASFDVLRLNGRRAAPPERVGRPLPALLRSTADQPPLRVAAALLGIGAATWTLGTLWAGPAGPDNPALGAIFGLFWVGLVPASLLLGPVWRHLNPIRTAQTLICRTARIDPTRGRVPLPDRLGYWPAAVGLFGFAWWELVAPARQQPSSVAAWLTGYAVVQLAAGLLFGSRWFERGDAFEVYSDLVGRLSPIGRDADGTLVLRRPLAGLALVPVAPGLLTTVAVLLGATFYDSLSSGAWWRARLEDAPLPTLWATLALAGTAAAVYALFVAAAVAAARLGGVPSAVLTARLTPSLVPIAAGYVIAHYFTLFVVQLQSLGGAGHGGEGELAEAAVWVPPALLVSLVQVAAVIVGHVVGSVAAHAHAARVLPSARLTRAMVPMLVCMLAITFSGLALLWAA
ncbi:hypothetical protein JNW91_12360 [Micromonospora sp. STR1_7]|uniref:Yip1 domain-containing protein n=1 Tax=Micromonospora parastrephiae TaxID=2806101 RepID=A0ABS1XTL1_9ACTN|nr:hypothetical protein [Micromonospora parastrephiae]MBM0232586.1 hypothetical protein [Micromonospora parastrephiae]